MFPARAGMSRQLGHARGAHECVPRASGDEPFGRGVTHKDTPCSPRERG